MPEAIVDLLALGVGFRKITTAFSAGVFNLLSKSIVKARRCEKTVEQRGDKTLTFENHELGYWIDSVKSLSP